MNIKNEGEVLLLHYHPLRFCNTFGEENGINAGRPRACLEDEQTLAFVDVARFHRLAEGIEHLKSTTFWKWLAKGNVQQ